MAKKRIEITHDELVKAFEFLDDLRESGITNMWGATPYLVSQFDMTQTKASEIHLMWIRSFNSEHTMDHRIEVALK